MNYSTIINESIEKVYQNGIATKILQHMDRIRNVSDLGQARRWIMELLQNSQDTAYDGQAVRVKVMLDEDKLQFLHNGKPFRTKDILSIVNQVSSKDPDENTVGKFGTGFMTTYQLSEVVEIQSVLKDEGLPFKPFSVKIDRRGADKEEILQSIFQTMEELKSADEAQELHDYDADAFHTKFIYHLEEERSRQVARTGMDDLKETILYVLLFSKKIGSVELVYHGKAGTESICYKRGEDKEIRDGICQMVIWETTQSGVGSRQTQHRMMYDKKDGLTIAACMDADAGFLKIPELVPRIFVGFPLIGAEDFPFPVILNSEKFYPNEPRSGISLVDNVNSKDAAENKALMEQAVLLYKHFLHTLVQLSYTGLEHLISMPEWKPDKEMSESWVKEHLYQAVYKIVSKEPMIATASGYCCLETDGMYLVSAETKAEQDGVKKLLSALRGYLVPVGEDGWLEAFAGYEQHQNKVLRLQDLLRQAQTLLANHLEEERMPAMEWCRSLYRLGMENHELAVAISAGEIAVFPNQNAQDWQERKLFRKNELYQAANIPEILKDVSEALDALPAPEEEISIRKKLLHQDFIDQDKLLMEYPSMELYNYIAKRTNRQFRVSGFSARQAQCMQAWHNAWRMMLACCPDEEMYLLAEKGWTQELPEYEPPVQKADDFMWKNTYVGVLSEMIEEVQSKGSLEQVKSHFSKIGAEEFYDWYNCLLKKAAQYIFSFNAAVYPNQNGELHVLSDLQKDEMVHGELKDIAQGFAPFDKSCGIYSILLDQEIKTDPTHVCSDMEAARKVSSAVTTLLSQQELSAAEMSYQESCTRLLAWIQEHPAEAQRLFPAFCKEEDQMRLLTAKAAVVIQKKASAYEELLSELGTDDPDKAMEKIIQMRSAAEASLKAEEESHGTQKSGSYFDNDNDIFYDDSLLEYCPQEVLQETLQEIGKAGEQYAFFKIREYLSAHGYVLLRESAAELCFAKEEDADSLAVVTYPDADGYHQPGYDILVTVSEKEIKKAYYFEVKTHTTSSIVKNMLYISNEQMALAARKHERYYILNVQYHYQKMQGERVEAYQDPVARIADGTLRNADTKYIFQIA